MPPHSDTAVIIGAGPAGLTAAYELLLRSDIKPVIFEATDQIGGIAQTYNFNGNRIDLGGHRFFTKSNRVMEWWLKILPLAGTGKNGEPCGDKIMLVRNRLSRIFFLRKFFDYPVKLNTTTVKNLGMRRMVNIGLDYLRARLWPIKTEKSLEDFFINRFGRELYLTFFKDYTEKVWGISCDKISPDWGAQRVKGLSISAVISHAVMSLFSRNSDLKQKNLETSLIEKFLYPKFGPGQMWEEVAAIIKAKGGKIYHHHVVTGIKTSGSRASEVFFRDVSTGETHSLRCDYVFSSMPVRDLIPCLEDVPKEIAEAAAGLIYRDFLTVGLLLKQLKIKNNTGTATVNDLIPDNWIYIQERDVKVGRLQIFNNWSPYLVKDPGNVWLGSEYFCQEGDKLWTTEDRALIDFASDELAQIGVIDKENILSGVVLRMPKAYPAYFGAYDRFYKIREFTDRVENLFLIGRNGMHRYNNQDHSMLTAMMAVDNILQGISTKDNIWAVNAEEEYHEKK